MPRHLHRSDALNLPPFQHVRGCTGNRYEYCHPADPHLWYEERYPDAGPLRVHRQASGHLNRLRGFYGYHGTIFFSNASGGDLTPAQLKALEDRVAETNWDEEAKADS